MPHKQTFPFQAKLEDINLLNSASVSNPPMHHPMQPPSKTHVLSSEINQFAYHFTSVITQPQHDE